MKKRKETARTLIIAVIILAAVFWLSKDQSSFSPTTNPSPTPTASLSILRTPSISQKPASPQKLIRQEVPFTSQAPFGEWSDPRQQDGCEEASSLMAVYWARGIPSPDKEQAKKEILAISQWQNDKYGNYTDTSAKDTAGRIIKGYFNYHDVEIINGITVEKIKNSLEAGNLVIVPINGQIVGNQFYTQPGPERHMLVITGYDYKTDEFITNDPGTRRGEDYRYKSKILFGSIRDYTTGHKEPIPAETQKNAIIVKR